MDRDTAFDLIAGVFRSGSPANGYLVTGDLESGCEPLVKALLEEFFPGTDVYAHPDIHWLRPEKKSRIISVEAIRERLIAPLGMTSYAGGWKVGVLVGADLARKEAANAFLKILEEPPPQTVFFLLSDAPERLLPTIVSRCHRVALTSRHAPGLTDPWRGRVLDVLRNGAETSLECQEMADDLAALLSERHEQIEAAAREERANAEEESDEKSFNGIVSARYVAFRRDFLMTLSGYFADEMRKTARGKGSLSRLEAFYDVDAVDELARTLANNVNEATALSCFTDRVRFPKSEEPA